jgi:hypothetical protein
MITKVKWYHIFSNWILLASLLYPFHKLSTFPLLVAAFPFGVFYLLRKWNSDLFLKLIISCIIHFVPFLFIPYNFTAPVLFFNISLVGMYIVFMYYNHIKIHDVYNKLFSESHTSIKAYISERFQY